MQRRAERPVRPVVVGAEMATAVLLAGGMITAPSASAADPLTKLLSAPPAVQLAAGDAPLGDGTALIMGGSGIPIPPQSYVDLAERQYLLPHGFTGTAQGLFTPEGLYPITGVKSLPLDQSVDQGKDILVSTIQNRVAAGGVDAAHPIVALGYSQSSTVASAAMQPLHDAGVPEDFVRFMLLANPSNPNGGVLSRFDVPIDGQSPTVPSLGITFSGGTPSDLYPTDIYTVEYDGFADFPRYPLNLLSDLNAIIGILYEHTAYLGFTPDQIANAIPLETAGDGLTDYYMIPAQTVPLIAPLQLLPVIGQPLYDLLEPDMRILVNLGYGNIDHGWDDGPADVSTPFGVFPPDLDWDAVFTALGDGWQRGVDAFLADLADPATYQIRPIEEIPSLVPILNSAPAFGFDLNAGSDEVLKFALNYLGFPVLGEGPVSFTDVVNVLTAAAAAMYAPLLPIADTATALLSTLPSVALSFLTERAADGDLLGGIGEAAAAFVGLMPFALTFGVAAPVFEGLGASLLGISQLFE